MSAVGQLPARTEGPSPAGPPQGSVRQSRGLFDRTILGRAAVDSVKKLDPRVQVRNPVMFVVLIGTVVTLVESVAHPGIFDWSVTFWLALTVLFANFAEAVAEGRGKAQADTLRRMRSDTEARRLGPGRRRGADRGGRIGQGRFGGLRSRRPHPVRRRDHRRGGVGRRVRDHRRVRAGDPRGRRRPLRGHRRDPGTVGPDRRADHGRAREDVPGPDDLPRGGGQPEEDAERDRADHPARDSDHRVRAGGGHAPALRALRGRQVSVVSSSPCWSA